MVMQWLHFSDFLKMVTVMEMLLNVLKRIVQDARYVHAYFALFLSACNVIIIIITIIAITIKYQYILYNKYMNK